MSDDPAEGTPSEGTPSEGVIGAPAEPKAFVRLESVLPRSLWVAYALGAVACLLLIWIPRYPAGIDLPQHAAHLKILEGYWDPASGYRHFYTVDLFTPYALPYLLAWPLCKIGGALFATKALLTLASLAAPLSLARWLKAVGGEVSLCLLGFLTTFAYAYQWGFFSMTVAAPIATAYLAAAAELRTDTSFRKLVLTSALGVALFFCHGITFAVTMLASGIAVLLQRNVRKAAVELSHFLPILAVLVPWYLQHRPESATEITEHAGTGRIANLFWALFYPFESYVATLGGLAVAAVIVVFGRPILARSPGRVAPFAVALAGALSLPDNIFDTAFVGSRFAHFVWLFAPAAVDLSLGGVRLQTFRRLLMATVLCALATQQYRLFVFNREIVGLDGLKVHLSQGADILLYTERQDSDVAGRVGQSPAWIMAERGGILENTGRYFQLPVKRRPGVPWPTEYDFSFVRGTVAQAKKTIGKKGTLLESADGYHLFRNHRQVLEAPGLRLVRWGQSSGKPQQNRATGDGMFLVGGRAYTNGFGVQGRSILQMRVDPGVRRVRGQAGLDDAAPDSTRAVFRIMDARRKVLWQSEPLWTGGQAVPFDVDVTSLDGDLFFLTFPQDHGSAENAHGDWLDVEGR